VVDASAGAETTVSGRDTSLPSRPVGPEEPVIYTAAGLPWRRRQASLAAPLKASSPAPVEPDDPTEVPGRKPEDIRRIMSSYQTGTLRGRLVADRFAAAPADERPEPEVADAAPAGPTPATTAAPAQDAPSQPPAPEEAGSRQAGSEQAGSKQAGPTRSLPTAGTGLPMSWEHPIAGERAERPSGEQPS
jgi:hypothetical protein